MSKEEVKKSEKKAPKKESKPKAAPKKEAKEKVFLGKCTETGKDLFKEL